MIAQLNSAGSMEVEPHALPLDAGLSQIRKQPSATPCRTRSHCASSDSVGDIVGGRGAWPDRLFQRALADLVLDVCDAWCVDGPDLRQLESPAREALE
jgi:hypothetical protein